MPTVLLDVPAAHIDGFCLMLSEEAITYSVSDSRDGVFEVVFTVEVTGSELQVKEAAHVLSQMDMTHYAFHVTGIRLKRTLRIAKTSGLRIVRTPVVFSLFGRPWIHLVEVSGIEPDLKNFKILKKRSGTIR
jgi:hypothetical protein